MSLLIIIFNKYPRTITHISLEMYLLVAKQHHT